MGLAKISGKAPLVANQWREGGWQEVTEEDGRGRAAWQTVGLQSSDGESTHACLGDGEHRYPSQ